MFKKRLLAGLLAALMVFSLTACGGDKPQNADNKENLEPIKIATKQMTEQSPKRRQSIWQGTQGQKGSEADYP